MGLLRLIRLQKHALGLLLVPLLALALAGPVGAETKAKPQNPSTVGAPPKAKPQNPSTAGAAQGRGQIHDAGSQAEIGYRH